MNTSHHIGNYPLGYANAIVFEIEKEDESEVFELDDYTVTIDNKTWSIASGDVTTQVVNGKTTYFITWPYLATDFSEPELYHGCLSNNTKEINKFIDFNFSIRFEDNC